MLGRPRPLYIRSNVEERVASAASAMSFTRRSGWSLGTRSPAVRRLKSVSCCFLRPRIEPSDARTDHDLVRAVELRGAFFNSLLGPLGLLLLTGLEQVLVGHQVEEAAQPQEEREGQQVAFGARA